MSAWLSHAGQSSSSLQQIHAAHSRSDTIPAQTRFSLVLILAVLSANEILKVETSDEEECFKRCDPLALLEAAMGHRQAWGSWRRGTIHYQRDATVMTMDMSCDTSQDQTMTPVS